MLRLPQDRTRAGAFSFPALASFPLTQRGCLLLSADGSSCCGPHLPWLLTRPRGRHCRQWGCTCPSLFFATGNFMWLSLRCGSRWGVRVLVRGGSRAALNGAPAGVYTSNVVYREVLQWFFLWVWGSLGSPLDSQFFFRAWALVLSKGMGWITLH